MPEEESATLGLSEGEDDDLNCRICGATFEKEDERNLHVLSHPTDHLSSEEVIDQRRKLFYKEVKKQQEEAIRNLGQDVKLSPPKPQHKPRRIYKPPSNRVGLTKLRMEDLHRCDACSCIYIDPEDYYKHMRNFHEKFNTVIPRTRRKSPPRSQSNADDGMAMPAESSGNNCESFPLQSRRPEVRKELDTSFITQNIIRHSIKSRWTKVVSTRMKTAKRPRLSGPSDVFSVTESPLAENEFDPNLKIKEEPQDDNISYLLSQVEVKIEPSDDDAAALLLSQIGVKIEPEDNFEYY